MIHGEMRGEAQGELELGWRAWVMQECENHYPYCTEGLLSLRLHGPERDRVSLRSDA